MRYNAFAMAAPASRLPEERKRIYLDGNATTRPHPEVVETVSFHLRERYGNPGSRHAEGRKARQALETARESIASILGADREEVVFTSGGTESTNMALFGAVGTRPATILTTAGEHPATRKSCEVLQQRGWNLEQLKVDAQGRLIPSQYEDLDWEHVGLATAILAHNETGVIQDLQPLARLCRERNVFFHVDAVQAVGKIPVDFHDLNASSLSLGAHKFHGPRGIGALLLRKELRLSPLQYGGHQESGRRPGTEAVALACGMARALELWNAEREERTKRLCALRTRLEEGLQAVCSPIVVVGAGAPRLPNTASIAFPGTNSEALLIALDLEGIACSLGSTCASGAGESPPALVAMGLPATVYQSVIRFSLTVDNQAEEIEASIDRISSIVARIRGSSRSDHEFRANDSLRIG